MEEMPQRTVGGMDNAIFPSLRINWQMVVLLLIVAALVFTRLWDLDNRSFGHDESIHAWESWKLVTGQGYRHDPVYHGPFGYHVVAFVYFLFGVNDTTTRIAPALFSIALVLLVWPLRRWLGQAGAIAAMFLLTISPTLMYRGRYFRHDIWLMVAELIMVICFFYYLSDRRERWLYIIAGALAVAMASKAISFIYGAIFGSFLVLYLLLEWKRTQRPLNELPVFDLVMLLATLALPLFAPVIVSVFKWNPLDYSSTGIIRTGTVVLLLLVTSAVIGIWWKRKVWLVCAAIYYMVYIVFYTTLFTNPRGIATGMVGMLGYWLSQQGVRRGGQPWYYFCFLNGLYEFLPSLLTGAALVYYFRAVRRRSVAVAGRQRAISPEPGQAGRRRRATIREDAPERAVIRDGAEAFVPFLLYWTLTNFAIWTWAGEKMPWQNMHLVLPLGLAGGWFIGKVWESTDWRKLLAQGAGQAAVLLPVAFFSFLVLLSTFAGPIRPFSGMTLAQLEVTLRWLLSLLLLCITVALLYRFGRTLGWSGWGRIVLALVFVVLAAVTVRFAWMVTFINQDYPTEFLMYADSTPDTGAVMRELDAMSSRIAGDKDLKVAYDNESSWPFVWYLRDYRNAIFFTGDTGLSGDAQVVIIGPENESKLRTQLTGKYLRREYRLIWWPNQDVYSDLTPAKIWNDLRNPERRKFWWDIIWSRKYPQSTTSWPYVHRFALYVRKDIAAQLWDYGPEVAGTGLEMPEDEYEKKRIQVSAVLTWGGFGTGEGQFNDPKGIAVDEEGKVYVVDTRNHRVQVFDGEGRYLRGWGRQGNGPGEFQEPWGIAVDKAGNVYIADTWNHRIQKFDGEGRYIKSWGVFGDTGGVLGAADIFYGPRDIEVDREGNLLVSDTGNKRVMKYTVEGEFLGQWGGGGSLSGQMREPCGVAVDRDGNVYVADVWNERVQKFDAGFNYVTQWLVVGWESELPVNKPYVAVDGRGDVYVTVPEYHRVVKFDGSGRVLAMWGLYGSDSGSFNVPSGIAVDQEGNIYVTDSGNHRIMKFAPIP
ncbi:MAG: TIGR03663 family protein [Chloroflexi bacterium]|nr:TIGR03663 family protein [Chloroflexota bacterium]